MWWCQMLYNTILTSWWWAHIARRICALSWLITKIYTCTHIYKLLTLEQATFAQHSCCGWTVWNYTSQVSYEKNKNLQKQSRLCLAQTVVQQITTPVSIMGIWSHKLNKRNWSECPFHTLRYWNYICDKRFSDQVTTQTTFRDVIPCSLVCTNRHFGQNYRLDIDGVLLWKWRQPDSWNACYLPNYTASHFKIPSFVSTHNTKCLRNPPKTIK